MSHIFLSYAREDMTMAAAIVRAIKAKGFTVWWDDEIPTGARFHDITENKLNEAKYVVVLWSKNSIDSDWVRAEAEIGRARGVLIPILIDDVEPPLPFRTIQTAKLLDWTEETETDAFKRIIADIRLKLCTNSTSDEYDTNNIGKEQTSSSGSKLSKELVVSVSETTYKRKAQSSSIWHVAGAIMIGVVTILLIVLYSFNGEHHNEYSGLMPTMFSGYLTDGTTGQPISGARLHVINKDGTDLTKGMWLSDSHGFYVVQTISNASRLAMLVVQIPSCEADIQLTLGKEDEWNLEKKEAIPPITTELIFYHRIICNEN